MNALPALLGIVLAASASSATMPLVDPRIVSAWLSSDGQEVLLFGYDGTYYQANIGGTAKGFERGTYAWDPGNGSLATATKVDTNGTTGLSHPGGAVSLAISGNTMTRTIGSTPASFSRVTHSTGSIVGAWFLPGAPGFVLFLGNGTYLEVNEDDDIPEDNDGFELGTYTWNSSTGALSATPAVKTYPEGGPSSVPSNAALTVSGNTLTVTIPGDDTDVLHRLNTNSSPIQLPDFKLVKSAEYDQFGPGAPTAVPYDPVEENYPFQGSAEIFDTIPAVSPTLKIGTRTPIPFDVDEDDGHFFVEGGYASKTLLDASTAFPDNTTYLISAGAGNSATFTLPAGGTFPSVPTFLSSPDEDDEGHWNGNVYRMDAQTLRWTPISGFNPAIHATHLRIEAMESGEVIVDQLLQGDVTFFELEDRLQPGAEYEIVLTHIKILGSATSTTGIFSGKQGKALSISRNVLVAKAREADTSSIFRQPDHLAALPGTQVTLKVGVENRRDATLQWQKEGIPIPGQTANSLTFLNLAQGDYGSYSVIVTGKDGTVTTSRSIILSRPTAYDQYATSIGLDPVDADFPELDHDKDGQSNYLEFVLGGDPKIPQGSLIPAPVITRLSGNNHLLAFRYNRRTAASGEIQVVEHSPDLVTWTPAVPGQNGVTLDTAPPAAGLETLTVTIPVTGPKYFARLRLGPEIVINTETSYKNFKEIGLASMALPASANTRAYGDFFGDGSLGLFAATLNYEPGYAAVPSTFTFWKRQPNGTFLQDPSMITGGTGSIHPRKALVADFNADGTPDIFVVSHGYDAHPYPGEKNKIVLSQPGGKFVINDVSSEISFFHGGTAADVDRDGDIDVITLGGDFIEPMVFLNQGDGNFVRELPGRLPTSLTGKQYYSLELADVDGDGNPDLLAGGHEWETVPTAVWINPGNFRFRSVAPIIIPSVPNEGVVLDFLVTGTGPTRALWVLRTSGGDSTFYLGRTLQKVTWPALSSTIPLQTRSQGWVDWIIPSTSGGQPVIVSDSLSKNLSVPQ